MEDLSLDGKVVLVAGRRWVRGLAEPLAAAGATLALLGPAGSMPKCDDGGLATSRGRAPLVETIEAEDSTSIEAAVKRVEREIGAVDVLVNCWLVEFARPAIETSDAEWDHVLAANLSAPFYLCRAVGRGMVGRQRGCIVNVVSGLATRTIANATATCASLAGLLHLTHALAVEWARDGIRVNGLGVGWMEMADRDFSTDRVTRFVPLQRQGRPDDLGSALLYLCSDASTLMTGEVLFVDGGLTAHA